MMESLDCNPLETIMVIPAAYFLVCHIITRLATLESIAAFKKARTLCNHQFATLSLSSCSHAVPVGYLRHMGLMNTISCCAVMRLCWIGTTHYGNGPEVRSERLQHLLGVQAHDSAASRDRSPFGCYSPDAVPISACACPVGIA